MKVMVFGVFDGLHEGHKFFLEEALRSLGEEGLLVVVVARDSVVKKLKNKLPQWHELKRKEIVQQFMSDAQVVLGDTEQGSYDVIKTHLPDMLCLGYDQAVLAGDLRAKMKEGKIPTIPIIILKAHKPEQYKSSLLA